MSLVDILLLYVFFRIKQVFGDFILQPGWMAVGKCKAFDQGGLKPLLAHAAVHSVLTLLIMLFFAANLWWLAAVDFVVHSTIDKLKALAVNRAGLAYKDNFYWWLFGLDQEAHNFTHLVYIVLVVTHSGAVLN